MFWLDADIAGETPPTTALVYNRSAEEAFHDDDAESKIGDTTETPMYSLLSTTESLVLTERMELAGGGLWVMTLL